MGTTQRLAIAELAQSQVQAYTTVNDAIDALESATNGYFTNTDNGNYIVSELNFVRFGVFIFQSRTADFTVTLPSTVNTILTERLIMVINETTKTLTIPGTPKSVIIPAGASRIIYCNGAIFRVFGESGVLSSVPQTVALFAAGHPAHQAEILRYVFGEKVIWPVGLTGSKASIGVSPAPGARLYLFKNGTQVGSVRISSGGAFTFILPASVTWDIGDILTVRYEALQIGTITFNTQADTNDTITLNDGTNTPQTFTYGGGGSQMPPGVNATQSGQALVTAVQASTLATSFDISNNAGIVTITNLLPAGGGGITKSDADDDYTVLDFASDTTGQNLGVLFLGTRA